MRRVAILAGLALGAAACSSPEAERVRGGDDGADVGNRNAIVFMHGGSSIYFDTPCATTLPECHGPLPYAGIPLRNRILRERSD